MHVTVPSGMFHELLLMHNPSHCTSDFKQAAVQGHIWVCTNAYVTFMTAIYTVLPSRQHTVLTSNPLHYATAHKIVRTVHQLAGIKADVSSVSIQHCTHSCCLSETAFLSILTKMHSRCYIWIWLVRVNNHLYNASQQAVAQIYALSRSFCSATLSFPPQRVTVLACMSDRPRTDTGVATLEGTC